MDLAIATQTPTGTVISHSKLKCLPLAVKQFNSAINSSIRNLRFTFNVHLPDIPMPYFSNLESVQFDEMMSFNDALLFLERHLVQRSSQLNGVIFDGNAVVESESGTDQLIVRLIEILAAINPRTLKIKLRAYGGKPQHQFDVSDNQSVGNSNSNSNSSRNCNSTSIFRLLSASHSSFTNLTVLDYKESKSDPLLQLRPFIAHLLRCACHQLVELRLHGFSALYGWRSQQPDQQQHPANEFNNVNDSDNDNESDDANGGVANLSFTFNNLKVLKMSGMEGDVVAHILRSGAPDIEQLQITHLLNLSPHETDSVSIADALGKLIGAGRTSHSHSHSHSLHPRYIQLLDIGCSEDSTFRMAKLDVLFGGIADGLMQYFNRVKEGVPLSSPPLIITFHFPSPSLSSDNSVRLALESFSYLVRVLSFGSGWQPVRLQMVICLNDEDEQDVGHCGLRRILQSLQQEEQAHQHHHSSQLRRLVKQRRNGDLSNRSEVGIEFGGCESGDGKEREEEEEEEQQ